MRLRAHRRNLVVWSSSGDPAGRYTALRLTRPGRRGRIRRGIRVSAALAVMAVVDLAHGRCSRWQLMLAGIVLTVIGIVLRHSPAGVVLLPGLLFLLSAPLVPDAVQAGHGRRFELERELATYSTPAQRHDLEATLDRYPDSLTSELRDILTRQAAATRRSGIPGTRQS
jgi:hypothetical protein